MPCSSLALASFKISVLLFFFPLFYSLHFQLGMLESPENQDPVP